MLPWVASAALVTGLGLGLLQPLLVVAVGVGIYAGPTYLGLLFLLCLAIMLLVGLVALVVRSSRATTVPIVVLSGCLALGMFGGNWLAASLHVSFAAATPPTAIHPTGAGWSATGDLLVGRSSHTATLLRDGRVLVAGGTGADERSLSSAELYDPRMGTWARTGSMVAARSGHTATALVDGRVLVLGWDGQAELYDPRTGSWSPTGSMTTPRTSYAVTRLPDGGVLVSGGRGSTAGEEGVLASSERYDPATGTWQEAGTMHVAPASHTATALADGRLLVAGGDGRETSPSNPMGLLTAAELYDPASGRWANTRAMEAPRSAHAAVLLEDGRVFVAGGSVVAAIAVLFDPATEAWEPGGKVESWASPSTSLLADGRVLIVDAPGSLEIYDPHVGTAERVARTAHGFEATATRLADGRVLIAGGTLIHYGHASERLTAAHLYDPR